MARKRKLPKNVTAYVDRHGKERLRYRKTGLPAHAFKAALGTKDFDDELARCRAGTGKGIGSERTIPGTVNDLVVRWYASADFNAAADGTRTVMRRIMERFRADYGADYVADFTFEHIDAILLGAARKGKETSAGKTRHVGGPEAAARLRKLLNRLFLHAVRIGMTATNPVTVAARVTKPKSEGFHTWTEAEIAQYQKRHKLGTKPRLALEIMLWTAQRGGDARLFGSKHNRAGKIRYRQAKTGKILWLPMAPKLSAAISAMPSIGLDAYLVTEHGLPFSPKGFGNWFRDQCDAAGLPGCTAHGLRKAAARRAAQLGAGNAGLKAVGGWSNDREVAVYTAEVDQESLAAATLGRVITWDSERDDA